MTPKQIKERLARIVELEQQVQSEKFLNQLSVERVALINYLHSKTAERTYNGLYYSDSMEMEAAMKENADAKKKHREKEKPKSA